MFALPALANEATDRAVILLIVRAAGSRIVELSTEEKQVSHLADINPEFERVRAGLDVVRPQL